MGKLLQEFDIIYRENREFIYKFIIRLTNGDLNLAEELTQETFYRAYISIIKFKGECTVRTWLSQIAKNIYFMHLRKQYIAKSKLVNLDNIEVKDYNTPDKLYENKERYLRVLKIIDSMSCNMKEVMIYRLFAELSHKEIAILLGKTETSIKVMFYRGKAIINEQMGEV